MLRLSSLNSQEKEQLQKIWDTDYQTIVSGKDNGVPFLKYVFTLHYKLFGEVCSNCPAKITGYIKNLKNLKENKMKKSENKSQNFKLNDTVTIPIPGTSKAYSNGNLTDEIAVELLAKNPNRKSLFSKLPKNIDKLIEDWKAKNVQDNNDDDSNLVKIGENSVTIEQAIDLLAKVNVSTKATTVTGVEKIIKAMAADVLAELVTLSNTKAPETSENGLSKEDLQFDLEKAQQDLEDLKAEPEKNAEAIEKLEATIKELKLQIGE